MSKSILGQQGFSLIELIVGIALLTLMFAGIFMAISTTNTVNANTMNRTQNVQSARDLMANIYPEFENASLINTNSNFAITCNINDDSPTTIRYTKGSTLSTIRVDSARQNLIITNGSSSKTVPLNGLQSLTIARDGNTNRRVRITLVVNNGHHNTNYTFEENVVSLSSTINWNNTTP